MKNLIYLLPAFMLLSCGGENPQNQQSANDSLYTDDHEWIVSAKELKEKLGDLQASFVEIGNKEVEETICPEGKTVPYTGNKDEMNIWLMATYMLDNFSDSAFGKNDFKMPDVKIKGEIPLRELDWLNFNSSDSTLFDLYKTYPGLTNIPKKVKDQKGAETSNEETLQKANKVLKALKDGLLVVIAITDYLPPKQVSETEFETGYLMGYILFADWKTGELNCLTPLLAQNNAEVPKELEAMQVDLQYRTFNTLDSIARVKTGFNGIIHVNSAANLEKYK
jgi:hypothetical protein